MSKKVKKKSKINLPKVFIAILITVLIIYLLVTLVIKFLNLNIKNIYIINNNLLSDQEIIELSSLEDYPSIIFTSSKKIKEKLKSNVLIKDVSITKKIDASITLDITEYEVLFYNDSLKETVIENGESIKQENIYNLPILINNPEKTLPNDIFDNLVKKYVQIDKSIREKISEIKYDPNREVDSERFILTMKDGNYVYITLTKIKNINNYEQILPSLEQKKGILYLDSGQYFEIFK